MGNIEHPTSNSEHRKVIHAIADTREGKQWCWTEAKLVCEPRDHAALRYLLLKPGTYPIAIVGLNPSTANSSEPDPTMKSVRRLMAGFQECGSKYDGFLMVNLYPLRTPNPRNLPKSADAGISKENLNRIEAAFRKHDVKTVWAAWGNNITSRPYLLKSLSALTALPVFREISWRHCSTLTKHGHPRHPLYLKTGTPLSKFEISEYLKHRA